jgi:ribosomal protein S12 methylthiotransferase accessory factor
MSIKHTGLYQTKDIAPEDTICNIKNILKENNINIQEQSWNKALDSIYSCRVVIHGSEIGANGKGIKKELALASAQAELMERLQNQILFDSMEFSPKTRRIFGFFHDINEKLLSREEISSLPSDFKKALIWENKSLYELWEEYREEISEEKIIFIPFYNVRSDSVIFLPLKFIKGFFATNGMCAGNTAEEAITQGLCEIMERYALRQIYVNHLSPPTIPEEYLLKNAPYQYNLIKKLHETGAYKIIVKDCSLGKGLPVVGIIVILKEANKYSFTLGSDPNFNIALERCLTEYFQGREIYDNNFLVPINILQAKKEISYFDDMRWILIMGMGHFPDSIFDTDFSYEFSGFSEQNFITQRERLDFLTDLIEKMSYNIYLRDVSFLGFNSYQIIIPGMSEVYFTKKQFYYTKNPFNKMESLAGIEKLNEKELEELASHIEYFLSTYRTRGLFTVECYMSKIHVPNMSVKLAKALFPSLYNSSPEQKTDIKSFADMSLYLFLSLIYHKLGYFEKAYNIYSGFLDLMRKKNITISVEYFSIEEFFYLCTKYSNREKIKNILEVIYDKEVIDTILPAFNHQDNLLTNIKKLKYSGELPDCWNCDGCERRDVCPYKYMESIYLNIKEKIKKNPINQINTRHLFKKENRK